jgi:hypothetical protein
VIHKSTSLTYEPSSEPLLITVEQFFLNRELYRAVWERALEVDHRNVTLWLKYFPNPEP